MSAQPGDRAAQRSAPSAPAAGGSTPATAHDGGDEPILVRIHPDDLLAIAREIAALLPTGPAPRLVDAATLAKILGLSRDAIYERAEELGAVRIGDGPRPRLRFDVETAVRALTSRPGGGNPARPDPPATKPRATAGRTRTAGNSLDNLPVRELQTKRGGNRANGSAPGAGAVTSTRQQATDDTDRGQPLTPAEHPPRRRPANDDQEVSDAP